MRAASIMKVTSLVQMNMEIVNLYSVIPQKVNTKKLLGCSKEILSISICYLTCLEKAMATHSSALAWKIPGTAETGGLPTMGSHRVGHD